MMNNQPNKPSLINDIKKTQLKLFDEYADLYQKSFALPYRQYLEIPTLVAILGDLNGLSLLDFGCGPGFLSRWLKDRGGLKIVGHDVSEGMLDYARRKEKEEPRDITYTSVLDNSFSGQFDIVMAVYVMPYASDKTQLLSMLQAMARVLKPGGRLITLPINPGFHADPEYYRPYGLRLTEKEPRKDGSPVNLHICYPPYDINIEAYYWSAETLEALLRQAGFSAIYWRKLQSSPSADNSGVSLVNYLNVPHAAIIEAIKDNKPCGSDNV